MVTRLICRFQFYLSHPRFNDNIRIYNGRELVWFMSEMTVCAWRIAMTIRANVRMAIASTAAFFLSGIFALFSEDKIPPSEMSIPFDSQSIVTFGPAGCPVFVLGQEVRDLKTGKSLCKISDSYGQRVLRALSADGKYFAAASKTENQKNTAIQVWSTESGKAVLSVPGNKDSFVDLLTFSDNKALLVGGRHSKKIDVWDLVAGKISRQLAVPGRRVESRNLTFSLDGRYFACLADNRITLTEMASNKEMATLAAPDPAREAALTFATMRGLAFSVDGTEIAAFSPHPHSRLLVWNTKGELLRDVAVPTPSLSTRLNLEQVPGNRGWVVQQYLFDLVCKRRVASFRIPFGSDALPHMADKDHVVGVFGSSMIDVNRLRAIEFPWDKLDASLKFMSEKKASFLAPGGTVSIELEIPGVREDDTEIRKLLSELLASRLALDGIQVGKDQTTILRLHIPNDDESFQPIHERQLLSTAPQKSEIRKQPGSKGSLVLELIAKGEDRPLWRDRLWRESTRSFKDELSDVNLRKELIRSLTFRLEQMDMPYFIPNSKEYVALPMIIE
jgi:hypothetical protein